ncbi:MAG: hypothetical protein GOMPHAMPRED_001517 [Gomphillus americanus]|uniref:Tat pathway signal sequence n=1 Tax=Gomphillus americanus TaxID=1940652 RepID=A0A8H3ILV9_9LECA|nr:MAG: hypothetical protein GOMPHAMPRED_001517 [Gomphillus americanus]
MSYQADEEEKPFLTNGSLEVERKIQAGHVDGRKRLTHRHTKLVAGGIAAFLALQIILIGIYTYVYFSFIQHSQSAPETGSLRLGASTEGKHFDSSAIPDHNHTGLTFVHSTDIDGLDVRWQRKKYTAFQDSPYTRAPSSSTDAAWERLLENMTIRVTGEELERAGQTSIELPGGGYMAWLGVHHELHCIKYIREWKYKEHFFPVGTEEEIQHRSIHAGELTPYTLILSMC